MFDDSKIEALLLWQKSRGLRLPSFAKANALGSDDPKLKLKEYSGRQADTKITPCDLLFISCSLDWKPSTDAESEALLNKMIAAMKLKNADIKKIRFDSSKPEELSQAFLEIKNCSICIILGSAALNALQFSKEKPGSTVDFDMNFSEVRGKFLKHSTENIEQKVIASWHPTKLIEQPILKQDSWNDLKKVIQLFS
jgi:uracil-DNA glycosylase family 4